LGGEDSLLKQGQWSASVAFRYYHSYHDVLGDEVQDKPIIFASTHVFGIDFNTTYAVNRWFNLSLDLPFQYGTRLTKALHDDVHYHRMYAAGIGDLRLTGNIWLFDPETFVDRNFSLGIGVKAPSGVNDAEDYSYRPTGPILRPVDPAIQPGDGTWGVVFTAHGFTSLSFATMPFTASLKNTSAYFDGTYIANPANTNGVEMTIGDIFRQMGLSKLVYDSVPDQFLVRAGFSQLIWPSKGVFVSLGARFEGTPAIDLMGDNDGFRLPGYSVSIDPGLTVSKGRNLFSVSVPVAIYRRAIIAQPFATYHIPPAEGLATIADWQVVVTYTRTF
jgi:hypothetical protein